MRHNFVPVQHAEYYCSDGSLVSQFLNVFVLFPHTIFIGLQFVSFHRYIELYFVWTSFILILNDGVNYIAKQLLQDIPPHGILCGEIYSNPDWSVQRVACFMTIIVTYAIFWKRTLHPLRGVLYGLLVFVTGVTRWYNGYSRIRDVVAGLFMGICVAVVCNFLTYTIFQHWFEPLANTWPFTYLSIHNDMIKPPPSQRTHIDHEERKRIEDGTQGVLDPLVSELEDDPKPVETAKPEGTSAAMARRVITMPSTFVSRHTEGQRTGRFDVVGVAATNNDTEQNWYDNLPLRSQQTIDEVASFGELAWLSTLWFAFKLLQHSWTIKR